MDRLDSGTIVIIAACVVVLMVGAAKRKSEWMLNILMRGILGTIAIYFINNTLTGLGIPIEVGINPVTVLTSGILGFPGLAALYGIGIYKIL
ncbi:MAG: pro-sigmaK processing inhibitor BofA family protein [Eubacterium sp.]|nr:pro-sigmaK processing inhibitor BofA family protein [Eubacterium sp.]MCM1214521.1 pro-sigmaK processing inhibitor BofA family protein [Lachnospiraceae bacterium]MCM1303565.1 pro-sigmaK processing inhibitor BofA family protein [Butyrivibrio sp.]MCM1343289.1 pro-sigmaK processing inhibitor BofA family protein [Muribaculaceae bacterium]MCM1238400.1 pro-sigmaK processing inhibitor BofA family protein [Lachnospiraceae bacterium]